MGEAEQDEGEKYIIGLKSGSVLALQSQAFLFLSFISHYEPKFVIILILCTYLFFLDK